MLNAGQWETARKHGLTCSVGYADAGNIADGLNNKANHDKIIQGFEKNIPLAKKAGVPNVIVFFGTAKAVVELFTGDLIPDKKPAPEKV